MPGADYAKSGKSICDNNGEPEERIVPLERGTGSPSLLCWGEGYDEVGEGSGRRPQGKVIPLTRLWSDSGGGGNLRSTRRWYGQETRPQQRFKSRTKRIDDVNAGNFSCAGEILGIEVLDALLERRSDEQGIPKREAVALHQSLAAEMMIPGG